MKKQHRSFRILFLTETYPDGLSGNAVKARYLLKTLSAGGAKIDVCYFSAEGTLRQPLHHSRLRFFRVPRDKKKSFLYRLNRMVWGLLSFFPLQVWKFRSPQMNMLLETLLEKQPYDMLLLDGFSLLQYARQTVSRVVYIEDENFIDLYNQRSRQNRGVKKLFYFFEKLKSEFFFRRQSPLLSEAWVINQKNQHWLRQFVSFPVSVIPTVVSLPPSAFRISGKNLVFTGLLNWEENVRGIIWFLEHCWRAILKQKPEIQLLITGRGANIQLQQFFRQWPNVRHIGYVRNLAEVYRQSAAAISPVFANSGIKIKMLTYLSYGLPVVSVSAATLGMRDSGGVKTADTPERFVQEVLSLLENREKRAFLSKAARNNIRRNHHIALLQRFLQQRKVL